MRPANLVHLYRIRLRSRLAAELLALVGIAVGVALVFASLVASASLNGSVRQLTEGIVGNADFQLSARSSAGFNRRVFAQVERIDGVAAAAPIVEVRANLAGPEGFRSVLLLGGDPRFARVGGPLLRQSARGERRSRPGLILPAPLVTGIGVGPGGTVRVETGSEARRIEVVGQLDSSDVGMLAASPVALAPLGLVQAAAGMRGRLSRIFVESAPGREREVAAALREIAAGRLNVGPADEEMAIFERAAYPTNQSTALFSVLSALVGFLFALNAMLLTVPQRRRLIADLRLAGYEPWVVVQLLLFDALVLGVAGSLLGLTLGDQESRHLFDSVPGYLTSAFAVGAQRIVTWESTAISGAAGVLAACVAVLAPVRDALSRTPKQPTAPASASGRRIWPPAGGTVLLALTTVVMVVSPRAALAAIATLTAAMLLLLPASMRLSASILVVIGRRTRSAAAILAVLELRSGSSGIRTLALTATGAIAVFATVAIGGARADLQRGLDAVSVSADRGGDVWVAPRGPANIFATVPFAVASTRARAIERLPGVQRVNRFGGSFLDVGDYRAWVWARPRSLPEPVPAGQVRKGEAGLANARLRRGGWLTLSDGLAADLGVDIGDRVVLPTPVPTGLRLAALTTNMGWAGGGIVVNAADYARAWGTGKASSLGIEVEDGATTAEVARSVRRVLGRPSPLRTETRVERMRRQQAASRSGLSRLGQISALVLISAVLAMAASMGGVIWQRRPTLAALKVHGVSESELWRSLLLESALLLGTGCLLGAIFGLVGQLLLDRALETITGFPVFYATAVPMALGILALITTVAVAMLALPGWIAVRVRPMTGISP